MKSYHEWKSLILESDENLINKITDEARQLFQWFKDNLILQTRGMRSTPQPGKRLVSHTTYDDSILSEDAQGLLNFIDQFEQTFLTKIQGWVKEALDIKELKTSKEAPQTAPVDAPPVPGVQQSSDEPPKGSVSVPEPLRATIEPTDPLHRKMKSMMSLLQTSNLSEKEEENKSQALDELEGIRTLAGKRMKVWDAFGEEVNLKDPKWRSKIPGKFVTVKIAPRTDASGNLVPYNVWKGDKKVPSTKTFEAEVSLTNLTRLYDLIDGMKDAVGIDPSGVGEPTRWVGLIDKRGNPVNIKADEIDDVIKTPMEERPAKIQALMDKYDTTKTAIERLLTQQRQSKKLKTGKTAGAEQGHVTKGPESVFGTEEEGE